MSGQNSQRFTIGPEGERLTAADLPPPDTSHWWARKKAQIVAAVNGGLITSDEALATYQITTEEFETWKASMARSGLRGLRATKIQRNPDRHPASATEPVEGSRTTGGKQSNLS